jgi:acyl carrier protein
LSIRLELAMDFNPEVIVAELTRLLRRLCQDEQLELTVDMPLDAVPGIDSLRLLLAVAHLEEHFHVEIDVVAIDDMYRVGDIVTAVSAARPEQWGGRANPISE